MIRSFKVRSVFTSDATAKFAANAGARASEARTALPTPAADPAPATLGLQSAVFAGGCFSRVQALFEHVKDVTKAVSAYASGKVTKSTYEEVGTGATGHAESVHVATRVEPAGSFNVAERYHQDYLEVHPIAPYIAINDVPKVEKLRCLFPAAWPAKLVLAGEVAATD